MKSVNGALLGDIGREIGSAIVTEQKRVIQLAARGEIDEDTSSVDAYSRGLHFITSFNTAIIKVTSRPPWNPSRDEDRTSDAMKTLKYFDPPAQSDSVRMPIWAVGDLNTLGAIKTAYISLRWALDSANSENAQRCRVSLLHSGFYTSDFASRFDQIVSGQKEDVSKQLLELVDDMKKFIDSGDEQVLSDEENPHGHVFLTMASLNVGQSALLVNGRIIPSNLIGGLSDVDLAVSSEIAVSYSILESANISVKEISSDDFWKIASVVSTLSSSCGPIAPTEPLMKSKVIDGYRGNPLILNLVDNSSVLPGSLEVLSLIDPAGSTAPMVLNILQVLRDDLGANITLILLPRLGSPDVPEVFSELALSGRPKFDKNGQLGYGASALFTRIPQDRILTLSITPPRAWLVSAAYAPVDTDNIVMQNISADLSMVHVEYSLDGFLVEGSCIDWTKRAHATGLQLELSLASPHNATKSETTVMSNVGHYQLKAPTPGKYELQITPGIGRDVYVVDFFADAMGRKIDAHSNESVALYVNSLAGALRTNLYVKRKEGEENTLLRDPKAKKKTKKTEDNRVHVFSIASGHLYERFLKIMMLSASKKTTRRMKFWLLGNYLSPNFKLMLPLFSKDHGFDFEFISYRWPSWLNEQTEKQRIIWAHKILFLDVLFPHNLSRVIFVDSDQVVRSDLAELYDMDLKGAPYGYVPFCDSRKEVEGFRFWKGGFWANHLGPSRKYHISALYVVDLERFRETSAGDNLRILYDGLSRDKNSLSNLDQDLPNFAQPGQPNLPGIPIHSLPQEWLWCESWCDDGSKATAKTIDLCNNPMTKEPKLESAKRIIPEWTALDEEASKSTQKAYYELSGTVASSKNAKKEEKKVDEKVEHDEL